MSISPRVSVDLTQIQQVFINLISNAMEALEGSQISPQKIAAITLTLWKRAERFDPEQLKTQAA
jgi:C4-dicarboxylate-specific signal transduction histidine kinase